MIGCQKKHYKIAPHSKEQEGMEIGFYVPNFTAIDSLGQKIEFEKQMGKVTLIDFWASWCRPCRESANPAYKNLYKKYHSKGFNIVGVSSDRHTYFWKKALHQDSLPWIQVIDSTHKILNIYQVKKIPTMYIIDKNGKVIGKNLWGKILHHKIDSLLNH